MAADSTDSVKSVDPAELSRLTAQTTRLASEIRADEMHYADHGVCGGWPHAASYCDKRTPEERALLQRFAQMVVYVPVGTLDLLHILKHPDMRALTRQWLDAES